MQQVSTFGETGGRHAACGFEPPYPEDETFPVPREIFPTGKWAPVKEGPKTYDKPLAGNGND